MPLFTPLLGILGDFSPVTEVALIWFSVCNQGLLVALYLQDYKSLCAAVTICATMVDPKLDFYIFTTMNSKSRESLR